MSRWDVAVAKQVPADLTDKLGLAVGLDIYRAYRRLMGSDRLQRLENDGARMQRLLWASTKTKDPDASDTLYVHGLAAPFTVNTMPDDTLEAFYDHGEVGEPMPADGGDADALLARSPPRASTRPRWRPGCRATGPSRSSSAWNELMDRIKAQTASVA